MPLRWCTDIVRRDDILVFGRTNCRLPIKVINKYYKRGLHYIVEILNNTPIDEIKETEKGIIFTAGGMSIFINNESNAGNFYEIVCRKMYEYHTISSENIVLDIGMNTGVASLFFASKENVTKVYAYEPFETTVADAKKNLELNPRISKKITLFNYGVSNKNTKVTVPLFEDGSMQASVNEDFIRIHHAKEIKKNQTIQIDLKDIKDILTEIIKIEDLDNKGLILKIDCEGEEYNIIDRLNECGHLTTISALLIEWHHKGPDSLVKTLKENNFKILVSPITTVDGTIISEAGMLYAFK
ncbi:FkbM family methyltransferase [Lacibacter sediminis]|uniref:FkbM family methyltransferase n=1 Tax=Lacibacter sediminis TaxID=2760713 RepID=A0A7G5XLB6_9BACT|nr:FkbM family methyltransferase [Lacibacter sediminis]QNA46269.1 FkbM family methyltransferase [Lacibacter sediminis]